MRPWKLALIIVLALLIIGAAGYFGYYGFQALDPVKAAVQETPPPTVPVESGDVRQLVSAPGHLLETEQMNLTIGAQGQIEAVKFTPAGGTITVYLHAEGEGGAFCLTVSDTGIGIPAGEIGMLFNRFHRARNASAYPGSGLGLAIVRTIAQAHGAACMQAIIRRAEPVLPYACPVMMQVNLPFQNISGWCWRLGFCDVGSLVNHSAIDLVPAGGYIAGSFARSN